MPEKRNLLTIRRACLADADAIAQIHVETWRAAYRGLMPDAVLNAMDVERRAVFWKERLTQNRGAVFAAYEEGQLIGFCDLIPSRDKDAQRIAEIAAVYVAPTHWRKGAGCALCQSAVTGARATGYRFVTLWVLASNTDAQRFYEKFGFARDGGTKTDHLADGTRLSEVRYRLAICNS